MVGACDETNPSEKREVTERTGQRDGRDEVNASGSGQIGPLPVLLKLLEGSHDVEPFLFKGFRILFVLWGCKRRFASGRG